MNRRTHGTMRVILCCVLAVAGLCGCTTAQEPGLPLVNPSFESWSGTPAGWNLDAKVRAKGKIAENRNRARDGGIALQLSPNAQNTPGDSPYGVGQLFSVAAYAGRDISASAWLGATGSATAVVGVYLLDARGQNAGGQQLRQAAGSEELTRHEAKLSVPESAAGMNMIVFCVVEGTSGHAYFDGIQIAAATGGTPAPTKPTPGGGLAATIRVDVSKDLRKVPRDLFGANLEWAFNANELWDGSRPREDVVALTKQSAVSLIRFPGGVFSDYYHWRDGIGDPAKRRTTLHYPNGPSSKHVIGTDELIQLADRVGARLLLTVNAGTGTPEEAADWVRYMDKSAPNATAFWEIGNELYMKDDFSGASMPPKDYARKVGEFAVQMREANPKIKLGAIGGLNQGRYSFISYSDWTRTVLRDAARDIDFIAVHNAYAPVLINQENAAPEKVYAAMLAAPLLIQKNLDALAKLINDNAGDRADDIGIAVTEWGPFFHVLPSSVWVDHVKTLGSALFVADTLRVFALHPKMEAATLFKLTEPTFMGWMGPKDGKYVAKPALLAFQFYTNHFFPQLVSAQTESPTYDSPEVGVIDAVRGVPYLTAIASRDPNGKRLSLIVVNKHQSQGIETEISFGGIDRLKNGTSRMLTGDSLDAHTGTTLMKIPGLTWGTQRTMTPNVPFNALEKANVHVEESSISVEDNSIRHVFPAHTVTCMEFSYE